VSDPAPSSGDTEDDRRPTLVVTDARVFDGHAAELVSASVHAVGGRIARLGDPDDTGGAPTEAVVDARGRTLTPGFIDAHCHAYGIGLDMARTEATPLSYVALKARQRLERALCRGFTTIRDVAGGDPGLARAVDEGLVVGPRYLYTGPALSQTGGHADPRPEDSDASFCCGHTAEVVDGVDAVRAAVRDRFRRGAHAIKLMTSGGVISPTDPLRIPQYSAEEVAAACEEATRRGSYVAAHAYSPEAIVHSVRNGVRSIEHGNLLDDATARTMVEHDAFLVPTLITYDAMARRADEVGLSATGRAKNEQVLHAGQHAVELARAAGVRIGFGTDLMGDLEDDQLLGFRPQVEADGVLDTLRAATSVNADLLQRDDLGRIAPGMAADLVLLDGDPFEDPSVLWDAARPRTVVRAGAVVHTDAVGAAAR
jgi:imidazolonepropionase-like amidohydrolase